MVINENGYTDIPKGKLVNIATSLEITKPFSVTSDLKLERILTPNIDEYLTLFREIGEEWLWFSRLYMPHEKLATILCSPATHLFIWENKALLELDFSVEGECELSYFGLTPDFTGKGNGKRLMNFALETAFQQGVNRIWVHTCTLDHPNALKFYRSCGFIPYKRQIEMADDPRFLGLIAKDKGDHYPYFD